MRDWFTAFEIGRRCAVAIAAAAVLASVPATGAPRGNMPTAAADARLAAVGYRLAQANGALCAEPAMMTGLSVHDLGGYDARDRARVAATYGLTDGFGVLDIVAGSAAERAGIRKGDELVAINGVDLKAFDVAAIAARASYDRTDAFLSLLDRSLRVAPTTLMIRRAGVPVAITLVGDPGCGGQFTVQPGRQLNAWSDGKYVAVTSRLMQSAADDSELAFVVAHEMAHNILGHRTKLSGQSTLFAQFGIGAGRVKATEIEADAFAIRLMASAGFDLGAADRFLLSSSKARWMDLPITHPGIRRRIAIVDAAVAQMARTQMAAAPGPMPAVLITVSGDRPLDRAPTLAAMTPIPVSPEPTASTYGILSSALDITLKRHFTFAPLDPVSSGLALNWPAPAGLGMSLLPVAPMEIDSQDATMTVASQPAVSKGALATSS